jgi:mannose-6-phosphate isomerase-like protein (cupin superfamily)
VILKGDQPRNGPVRSVVPGSHVTGLITGLQTQGSLAIFEQTMIPTSGVGLHINHREDEWFYVMEGAYLFEVDGQLSELGPASFVLVRRGIRHRFLCVGDKPGKMLVVCQPAGIEHAFEEAATLPTPIDPAAFAAVARKYGIEMLGPPLAPR